MCVTQGIKGQNLLSLFMLKLYSPSCVTAACSTYTQVRISTYPLLSDCVHYLCRCLVGKDSSKHAHKPVPTF